jgi:hypothetical protein
MLGAGIYPITIAEMLNYSKDADRYFKFDEHESLKTYLALHPESGDVVSETNGVRLLHWPLKRKVSGHRARIAYYFRDLNMPLYMLALYKPRERIPLDAESKGEMRKAVDELVAQHSEQWAAVVIRQLKGGNEPA